MSVPIHLLNEEQKNWYSRIVVAAILADEEVSVPEVEYIRYVMNIVSGTVEKSYIIESIRNNCMPELDEPPNLKPEFLTVIFIELILIMISDFELLELEVKFLDSVARLFGFPEAFYKELMAWGEEGLKWKNFRRHIVIGQQVDPNLKVPLERFNEEQKVWYATALVSAIICDKQIDENEIRFVNKAVSIIKRSDIRKRMLGWVNNKVDPRLGPPPDLPDLVLVLIYMELLLIVSADESLSIKEVGFLRSVAELCRFSNEQYQKLINWCKQGIQWKKSKIKFIKSSSKLTVGSRSSKKAAFKPKPKANKKEVFPYNVTHCHCFLCDHGASVPIYLPKKETSQSKKNIFQISSYTGDSHLEFGDYNRYRVFICPSCYFASDNSKLFMVDSSQALPDRFRDSKLRQKWLALSINTKSKIKTKVDLETYAKRTIDGALVVYQQAIHSSRYFLESELNDQLIKEVSSLRLHMAEILMKAGREKDAENQLLKVASLVYRKFSDDKNRLTISSFYYVKFLFLNALYFEDEKKAVGYFSFFNDAVKSAHSMIEKELYLQLKEMAQVVERIYRYKESYFRSNLNGFHLRAP